MSAERRSLGRSTARPGAPARARVPFAPPRASRLEGRGAELELRPRPRYAVPTRPCAAAGGRLLPCATASWSGRASRAGVVDPREAELTNLESMVVGRTTEGPGGSAAVGCVAPIPRCFERRTSMSSPPIPRRSTLALTYPRRRSTLALTYPRATTARALRFGSHMPTTARAPLWLSCAHDGAPWWLSRAHDGARARALRFGPHVPRERAHQEVEHLADEESDQTQSDAIRRTQEALKRHSRGN